MIADVCEHLHGCVPLRPLGLDQACMPVLEDRLFPKSYMYTILMLYVCMLQGTHTD